MKIRCLLFMAMPIAVQAQEYRLAYPRLQADTVFFSRSARVNMEFDQENATIHYRVNGEAAPSSPVYRRPLLIKKSCSISALATHPDFLTGPTVRIRLVKIEDKPISIDLDRQAHEYYPGQGALTLFDSRKGADDLKDGSWLGFLGGSVEATCRFSEKNNHKNLIVSTLSDTKTWVFPPKSISVYGMNDKNEWQKIGQWDIADSLLVSEPADYDRMIPLHLDALKTDRIKVVVRSFGVLPAGHPGAGSPAWVFLDELAFQ